MASAPANKGETGGTGADAVKKGGIGDTCAYGDWNEGKDSLEINIKDAKKGIKLKIDGTTELELNKECLQIIIPKQADTVTTTAVNTAAAPTPKPDDGSKKDATKEQASEEKKNKSTQDQKGNETVLENVVTMLKTYKGIVITAFIAISLGLLLRRKFKAAGH